MEDTLWDNYGKIRSNEHRVLILILMEDTLWDMQPATTGKTALGLNPYSNGRYSMSLWNIKFHYIWNVLILILMEYALWDGDKVLNKDGGKS